LTNLRRAALDVAKREQAALDKFAEMGITAAPSEQTALALRLRDAAALPIERQSVADERDELYALVNEMWTERAHCTCDDFTCWSCRASELM